MHHQHKQTFLRLHFIIALCALLAGCQTQPQANSSTEKATPVVVASVNGKPISAKLYDMYLKNGQGELGINPSTEEGRQKLEVLREGIVSELIDRSLIAQEAERRGLILKPDEMAEAERRTVSQFGGDKQYDAYLLEHHLTRDEYREVIKWEIYGRKMRDELVKGLDVTDDEVKKYYDEHKSEPAFQLPERVTASHILVAARPAVISQQLQRDKNLAGEALEKAVAEEMKRRRERAEELRRKAAAGANFAALARSISEDPSSSEQGGDLGTFTRNSHPQAFDDAAFALRVGAVSSVVQTDYGFHIIKVSAHEKERVQTLAEATPEIRRRLLAEREAARLKEWLKEARRSAQIRINDAYRFGALKTEFPAI